MAESDAVTGQTTAVRVKKKSSFVGDVLKLVGSTIFAQTLSILVMPILSRLYTPDAFGALAVFISITGIISTISCLRYELAIMLPESDKDAANLLAVSLCSVLAIAGLTTILVLLGRGPIVRLLNAPNLAPYFWLLPLAVLASGGFLALNYWNSRTKHFGRLSIARISQSVAMNGTQLGMGVIGQAHTGGLVGGRVLGSAVVTSVLGGQIWRDDQSLFAKSVNWHGIRKVMQRYKKFPLLEMWGAFFNGAAQQLPVLLLSFFFSQAVVGYFALGNQLLQIPAALIGSAVAQVFFQRASEVYSSKGNLAKVVEGVYQQLVNVGLFPAILLIFFGQDLIVVVFGQEWAEAGIYVQILALLTFLQFISSPLSTLFVVLERQELALVVHGSIFFSRLLPLVIGGLLENARIALFLYAIAGTFVYGGLAIWNLNLVGKSAWYAISRVLRNSLYCLPLIVILLLIDLWFEAPALVTVGLGLLALGGYLIVVVYNDLTIRRLLTNIISPQS